MEPTLFPGEHVSVKAPLRTPVDRRLNDFAGLDRFAIVPGRDAGRLIIHEPDLSLVCASESL